MVTPVLLSQYRRARGPYRLLTVGGRHLNGLALAGHANDLQVLSRFVVMARRIGHPRSKGTNDGAVVPCRTCAEVLVSPLDIPVADLPRGLDQRSLGLQRFTLSGLTNLLEAAQVKGPTIPVAILLTFVRKNQQIVGKVGQSAQAGIGPDDEELRERCIKRSKERVLGTLTGLDWRSGLSRRHRVARS